jgi:hypothetical protein
LALGPVLGRADEHFDHVVVQTVIELALESPLELRVVEVPGMKFEVIGMNWNRWIPELDHDLHGLALGAGRKIKQRVFVESQLRQNALKPWVGILGHDTILTGVAVVCAAPKMDESRTADS